MRDERPDQAIQRLVLVTGPSGAGRSTAVNALEDLGYEVIDNLPLSLLPRLLEGPPLERPLALGVDVRNRDFDIAEFLRITEGLRGRSDLDAEVLFLDCSEEVLVQRYSETRRRHPLAPKEPPLTGILLERELLAPLKERADSLMETSGLAPRDLVEEIGLRFGEAGTAGLDITVQSFAYKRGLPRGADLVFDCRFLRNPHWEPALRDQDGRDRAVADYVIADARFEDFFTRIADLLALLLPAYQEEGKSHLSVAFGCTGGQHRSVTMTEKLSDTLAEAGWRVSKRHRELERRAASVGVQAGIGDTNSP